MRAREIALQAAYAWLHALAAAYHARRLLAALWPPRSGENGIDAGG